GNYSVADSVVIFWPADKYRHRQIDRYDHVPADRIISYEEQMGNAVADLPPNESIAVYPSPATNVLNISHLKPSLSKRFEVYDLLGKRLVDAAGSDNTFSLSVNSLKPGCYVLRITSNGTTTITQQFIKD